MTDKGQPIEDLGDAVKHLRSMVDILTGNGEFICPSCDGLHSSCGCCHCFASYNNAVEFLKANGGVK